MLSAHRPLLSADYEPHPVHNKTVLYFGRHLARTLINEQVSCLDAGYGKVEKRVRTTGGGATGSVRNLRIREDTAKYLLNLDPSSAHYDPKSRSMREDPQPHKAKKAFAGDNFVRKSGDYHAWEAERLHQLAAYDHGATLHMQAAPSQAEILHQNFKVKKDKLQVRCWLLALLQQLCESDKPSKMSGRGEKPSVKHCASRKWVM